MAAPEVRRLRLWQDRIETEVEISGSGPPLVYLHGPWGLVPDRPFVAGLASAHTVYAPQLSRHHAAAIPRRCMRSTAGSISSSITASCSIGSSSTRPHCSAIPSAGWSPPKLRRRRRSR